MAAKEEKIQAIAAKLEQGVKDVFTSENYLNYLNVMSRFHSYSLNNTILIAMQKPDATLVAGFKAWNEKFKRHVNKGEKGIQILAPVPHKSKKEVKLEDGTTEIQEICWTGFTPVYVFDISQTSGEDLPEYVHMLSGDVDGYSELVKKLINISPVSVSFEDVSDGANGFYHLIDKKIVIQSGMSEMQTVKTLIHEISHAILHNREDGEQKKANRMEKEVQAESTAYVVSNYIGLDTSDYSFGYVAGWSSEKDVKELTTSLDIIRKTAKQIIDAIE